MVRFQMVCSEFSYCTIAVEPHPGPAFSDNIMRTHLRVLRQLCLTTTVTATATATILLLLTISLPSFALPLGVITPSPSALSLPILPVPLLPKLDGDWAGAKAALRHPDCCVVSVSGLEHHLCVLQAHFADDGPAELDLRARVHVGTTACTTTGETIATGTATGTATATASDDCLRLRRSVSRDLFVTGGDDHNDPCTAALVELARGVASLAETGGECDDVDVEQDCVSDVFVRIVCASDYKAIDPMYHTDKAPLRAYVTLRGVGTEFMTRPCSPLEYVTLRGLGKKGGVGVVSPAAALVEESDTSTNVMRVAEELELIVMKGDHYECAYDYEDPDHSDSRQPARSWSTFMNKVWTRTAACVHRSPPAATAGGRRVIVSLDLADGDDDREWYQANTKREWRSGMTQRKSRLVA
jgi:hypothetical protein